MDLVQITGSADSKGAVITPSFMQELARHNVNFSVYNRDDVDEEIRGMVSEAGAVLLIDNGVFRHFGITMDMQTQEKILKYLLENEGKVAQTPCGMNKDNRDPPPPGNGSVGVILTDKDFSSSKKYKKYKILNKELTADRDAWKAKCLHQTKLYNRCRARISAMKKLSSGTGGNNIIMKQTKFGNVE